MEATLGQAKAEARGLLQAGDYARALRLYHRLVAAAPLDYDLRLRVGDVLAKVGMTEEAAEVYRTIAVHDVRSGHPLPALVACAALDALGRPADDVLGLLARTYGAGSPQLARFAVRPAPMDPDTIVSLADDAEGPLEEVAAAARARAVDLTVFVSYQQQYHPLPLLSELAPEALLAVLKSVRVRRFADGAVVMAQGEPGQSLFLVAGGEVRVFASGPGPSERELARLFENSLFGEMALLTDEPRAASVAAVGEADVVEVSREALDRASAQIPAIREALDRFARERLIRNLLASSPLFAPFTKPQQAELLRRFEGIDVAPGTEVIREGEPGKGLFVVLSGALEVRAAGALGDAAHPLAQLGTGDIFGEMALLAGSPTTATVRATSRATLLFLARGYFERLAAAVPEVRTYFEGIAARRVRDNTLRVGGRGVPMEPLELDASDAVLLI
jgi:CRP-like cAMP-binding protein